MPLSTQSRDTVRGSAATGRQCRSLVFPNSTSFTNLVMLVDGPHFQATNEGELVFLLSDGDTSRHPTDHAIIELEEETNTVLENYYLHIPLEHPDSHRWRDEIAKHLAPLVLGSTYSSLTMRTFTLRASLTAHFRSPSPPLPNCHPTYTLLVSDPMHHDPV
jgi:hypothetical protein